MREIALFKQHLSCILLGMLFALSACSAEKAEPSVISAPSGNIVNDSVATNDVGILDENSIPAIPVREFLKILLASTPDATDAIAGRINIPSIWVFSPQGFMTRMVSKMDELESFIADFQTADPKLSSITCKAVESAVSSVSQTEWDGGCGNGQWIALLLVNKDRFNTCSSCQEYQSVLDQIKEEHTAIFQAHVLSLDMN